MTVKVWIVVAIALVGGCRAPSLGSPRPRFEHLGPSEFLPNDLDFVVRIDLARLRNEPAFGDLGRRLASAGSSALLQSILPVLERSRAVFVGGRFMADGFHGDGVVAIETNSSAADTETNVDPAFRRIEPSPAHLSIFERNLARRDEASLQVVLDGGIVLATPAEEDAVLRLVRLGPDQDRVDPPALGLASFAARTRARTGTFLHGVDEGLARCVGSLEAAQSIQVEAELFYTSEDGASRAAAALRSLLDRLARASGPLRTIADSVKLAREAEVLRLRASVPFAVLAELH
jgi:hypothetical protein